MRVVDGGWLAGSAAYPLGFTGSHLLAHASLGLSFYELEDPRLLWDLQSDRSVTVYEMPAAFDRRYIRRTEALGWRQRS